MSKQSSNTKTSHTCLEVSLGSQQNDKKPLYVLGLVPEFYNVETISKKKDLNAMPGTFLWYLDKMTRIDFYVLSLISLLQNVDSIFKIYGFCVMYGPAF
jgi:hypothetical protein